MSLTIKCYPKGVYGENTYLIEENAFSGLDNLMVFVEGKTEIKVDTSNLFKLYICCAYIRIVGCYCNHA